MISVVFRDAGSNPRRRCARERTMRSDQQETFWLQQLDMAQAQSWARIGCRTKAQAQPETTLDESCEDQTMLVVEEAALVGRGVGTEPSRTFLPANQLANMSSETMSLQGRPPIKACFQAWAYTVVCSENALLLPSAGAASPSHSEFPLES